MKVTLREKPINDGKISLYLDFYPAISHPETGKDTRREFLGLYLFDKPRTELDRQHNKATKLLAQNICATRQLEVQAGNYGFLKKKVVAVDFLAYFKKQADIEKARDKGSRNNWNSAYLHLYNFTTGKLTVDEVTADFCKSFRDYLTTAKPLNVTKSAKKAIAHNSAKGYFVIFGTALNRAVDDKLFTINPNDTVKGLTRKETQREFLTLAELQSLAKTECDLPYLKRAALFSALTGLRYSDVAKLTWSEVYEDVNGSYIRFMQQKTEGVETLPLNETARILLAERSEGVVFPELLYSSWQNQKLSEWAHRSGIKRRITFHAFRHTFATLQLMEGTDLYTISKLLGHRNITTTQIYAKIVDTQKRAAVNRLSIEITDMN
ncbi:tyrosine-type recombinase/integrase [Spirosoma linguale]|uniref:Integrase family protein n=1 Tax=Spirosoma linguale (strain ATCC 33905 / DSM 74 / LMG 10896 / Claus 1) TaxID=504472 RepID=D2QEW1_SPILD|nr:integrase family protein [Spirosoma linguale DSM 74]